MKKFGHKRSQVTSRSDRSSGEGNRQVLKQRSFPNLASDSSSCSTFTTEEDLLSFELRGRSSRKEFGAPMKKLLAEEMSRETESKRRSPSVIARLMGLEGLPHQQPAHRQYRDSAEIHQQGKRSIEKARKSGTIYDHRTSRRSSKDQQEFKDVFEVSEIPKVQSRRYLSQEIADSNLTDAEMSFIQQKFTDAKRLSTDRNSQNSKEFHDALDVLDSNKELLLKYLQQPDSLLTKHLKDLEASPLQSHCGHLETLKTTHKCKNGDPPWKLERGITPLNYNRSSQKRRDGSLSHLDCRNAIHSSVKSSKIQLERKDEPAKLPTRIVVLKPNLGKVQNASKTASPSSLTFLSDHGKHTEFPNVRTRRGDLLGKKNIGATLLEQNSTESRQIAKEITRKMKDSFNRGSIIVSSSRFRGYTGDESSCDYSGNDSGDESVVKTATLRNSFYLNNPCRLSASHSNESSVSREAKKRLSERWKMTHKSQEVQVISRGSTLADMLAIPAKEIKHASFDGTIGVEGFYDKFSSDDGPAARIEPLGISSRDGWKDGSIQGLSRSRSLPASSNAFGSPRTNLHHDSLHNERYMMPREAVRRGRKTTTDGLGHREGVSYRNPKYSHRKSRSSRYRYQERDESFPNMDTSQDEGKTNFEESNASKENLVVCEALGGNFRDTVAVPENVVDVGLENATISSEPSIQLLPGSFKSNSKSIVQNKLMPEELSVGSSDECSVPLEPPLPGLESISSCKDADQPSPISVLEPSFTDDVSSCSECFESLSADLHGLRMQLQLLKSESDANVEGPMLVSSDEDDEVSARISDENGLCRNGDNWESSYIVDVLSVSGLTGAHPDTFLAIWHTPECPVNPLLFEELEKKCCDPTSCPRSERRLLFDRINSGLLEIHQQSTDPHPLVRPRTTTKLGSRLMKNGLQDGLFMLLAKQENKASKDALGKLLTSETQWLDLREDIDVIGRELETLLIDELIGEAVGTD
ncbi:VARLMGL domain-containing protein [Quillaja saponaria]|uniref:VARLMGL domain-containing protein n=1 Tax=Quillaja saponaria TaxID=32244 RepID=A0AAD7VE60_QUISA|nr:VARLMGL domain-containing protein [Quillaja saponaria]